MKLTLELLLFSFLGFVLARDGLKCSLPHPDIPDKWKNVPEDCQDYAFRQISITDDVVLNYLAMYAHFSRDTINRTGFAKYFLQNVEKARKNLINLLNYLLLRGVNTDRARHSRGSPTKKEWHSVDDALEDALEMEIQVTKSLDRLMRVCDDKASDWHILDYVQKYHIDEQIRMQRDLVEKIGKIKQMSRSNESHGLAEFILDKEI